MQITKKDPFPGTDYSQYLNWKKVVLPNGQVYYVVPGNPGYAFDPVASNATVDGKAQNRRTEVTILQ